MLNEQLNNSQISADSAPLPQTEQEIISAYLDGDLKGIFVTQNCFYLPLRITGLGRTLRPSADGARLCEIDRSPAEFANEAILPLYNGLPILIDHPQDENGEPTMLNFANFSENRIVGTTICAHLRGNEVWGLGKIFDLKVIDELQNVNSTSPAVESYVIIASGKELPISFNHLAIVARGHWDRNNPSAVAIDTSKITIQGDEMADEVKNEALSEVSNPEAVANTEAEAPKEANADVAEAPADAPKAVEIAEKVVENVIEEVKAEVVEALESAVGAESSENADIVSDTPIKADTDAESSEKVDSECEATETSEKIDEELIDSAEVTSDDKERDRLVDSMREICDKFADLKMPFVATRLKPSAVIHSFLESNRAFVDSKFVGLVDDRANRKNMANYSLMVDAYNTLCDKMGADSAKEVSKARGWVATDRPNVKIDRNF